MNIKILFKKLNDLNSIINELNELQSANGLPIQLAWKNKTVFIDYENSIVYRIENKNEVYKRILLREYVLNKGLDLFEIEEIILETSLYVITKQILLRSLYINEDFDYETKLKIQLGKRYELKQNLFKQLGIIWFDNHNSGLNQNNEIRIFDYVSITVVVFTSKSIILKDGIGEELWIRPL